MGGGRGLKVPLLLNTEGVKDSMDEIDNFPTVCSPTNDDFEAVGCAAGPVNPTLEGTTAVCAISCCAMPSLASLYLRVENSHLELLN